MHIKKGDTVEVISGDDRGKRGKVLSIQVEKGKLVIEGINRVYKHMRKSQRNPQGGRLSREMPVDVSNVMLIDPSTNQPTRVGIRYTDDGRKELYAKKSGTTIRVLSKPRKAYAKKK
jgi:large subunit ribosomal protein L24